MAMENMTNLWSIALLVLLRLGVPLIITIGLAYALRRLDLRWQTQARESRQMQEAVVPLAPGAPARAESWMLQPWPASSNAKPCWMVKGCTEALRASCAATRQPSVPCWQARSRAEGRLPAECKGCELYLPAIPYVMTETRTVH